MVILTINFGGTNYRPGPKIQPMTANYQSQNSKGKENIKNSPNFRSNSMMNRPFNNRPNQTKANLGSTQPLFAKNSLDRMSPSNVNKYTDCKTCYTSP